MIEVNVYPAEYIDGLIAPTQRENARQKGLNDKSEKKKKVFLTTRAVKCESINLGNTETSGH